MPVHEGSCPRPTPPLPPLFCALPSALVAPTLRLPLSSKPVLLLPISLPTPTPFYRWRPQRSVAGKRAGWKYFHLFLSPSIICSRRIGESVRGGGAGGFYRTPRRSRQVACTECV